MNKVFFVIVMFLLLFIATGVEAKSSAGYVGGIVMESQSSQGGRNHCSENASPYGIPGFADEANHSRANRRKIRYKQQIGRYIAYCIRMTIDHFFPDLYARIRTIKDCRKKRDYELVEIIMAGIVMFIFKKGSRNGLNNDRKEEQFRKNYKKIFDLRLPHMDSVNKVMRKLPEENIEKLKNEMVKVLIEKKVFHKNRLLEEYYMVALDGTRVMNVPEGHCDKCLYTTSKKGKKTYFHNVLEAMLVTDIGFCTSLGSEWIENPNSEFDKQDCELKAFTRLSKKLKNSFSRLSICIAADGLYPNRTFFETCKDNGWKWIITFKDGNLPSVWKEVISQQKIRPENKRMVISKKNGKEIIHYYSWINEINYHGHLLNWFECTEHVGNEEKRFVYVSNLKIDYNNVIEMTSSGRMRWKIENEGFNILKNNGYELQHKYSRTSMQATKNFYQCMLIAHLLNQLLQLSPFIQSLLHGKQTIKNLWEQLVGYICIGHINEEKLKEFINTRRQFRYG